MTVLKWKFSDQPTAWIAAVVAIADVVTELGVPVGSGLRAAIIALITAIGALVTWRNVTPANPANPNRPATPNAPAQPAQPAQPAAPAQPANPTPAP